MLCKHGLICISGLKFDIPIWFMPNTKRHVYVGVNNVLTVLGL